LLVAEALLMRSVRRNWNSLRLRRRIAMMLKT
jgi:hypothetical protein